MKLFDGYALLLIVTMALSSTSCKTVNGNSETLYANGATDLASIKRNSCVNYIKVGDCLLRLNGYESSPAEVEAFKKEAPKYNKILVDYGSDLSSKDDPDIIHIVESAKASKLADHELLALATYMGPKYSDMNAALRNGSTTWEENRHVIYNAASALTHLKARTFKGKVYRSEKTSQLKKDKLSETYKVGNVVVEQPFLSTTSNETLHFAESDIYKDQILIRYTILSKAGVAVSDFSPTKSEDEILFTPGSVFKVLSFSRSIEDVITDEEKGTIFKADTLNIGLEEIVDI